MPDKKQRFQNLKNSLVVFGLITLLIGCFLLAVITPFALEVSKRTAYADSTDGVVNDNIFSNPDFTISDTSDMPSFTSKFAQDIYYDSTSTSVSFVNGQLVVSGSGIHWVAFLFRPTSSGIYTFAVNYNLTQGTNCLFRLRTLSYTTLIDTSSFNFNTSVQYFSYNITDTTQYYIAQLVFPADFTGYVNWVKFEQGSSFTGYVPKLYENYGYNQGYDQGVKDTVDRVNLNNGVEILGSFSSVALKYNPSTFFGLQSNNNFEVYGRYGQVMFSSYDQFENTGLIYSLYGPSPSGSLPPQYFSFLSYDSSTYKMSINVPAFGSSYVSILPIAYNLQYIGQSIYITSDFVVGANYRIYIRAVDGSQNVLVSDYTIQGQYNGVNFADLSSFLVNGQRYNFYLCPVSANTSISISTNNSYYTGLNSLCLFTINDAYTVGVDNYNQGYDDGYKQGYNRGNSEGFSAGEISGAANANNYTFLGVIGAVIDAPIAGLKGLLNFELLGYNMQGFVLALLSLSVIILIIRLILGGK